MSAPARPRVSTSERRTRLARHHRLLPEERTDEVATIADDLVALHSSDPTTVYLSAFARMENPSVAAVDAALYDDRSLVRHHAMRRTIWVMSRAVTTVANASSTRKVAASERKKMLGWLDAAPEIDDSIRWLDDATERVVNLLHETGTALTREIGQRLPDLKIGLIAAPGTRNATELNAHTRVPLLAAMEGLLVRARPAGSWASGQYSWAALDEWIDGLSLRPADGPSVREASADLAARLLGRFGPMTTADLQWWTGWTKSQTKEAIADIHAVEVDLDDGATGWVTADDPILDGAAADDHEPWVAMLPGLDPTTMGWKQRDWYVEDRLVSRLFDRWGNAGPTIWVDGRIVGGWAQGQKGELAIELYEELSPEQCEQLEGEMVRLLRAIGDTRYSIRFPSPSHKDLVA